MEMHITKLDPLTLPEGEVESVRILLQESFPFYNTDFPIAASLRSSATKLSSQNGTSIWTSTLIDWQKNGGRRMVQSCIRLQTEIHKK